MQYSLAKLKKIPDSPGVYFFWNKTTPIYIGKAINLRHRLTSYFSLHLEKKTAAMVASADKISFIKTASELEALLLEAQLINTHQPKYNIIAKDDKHALYIRITKEVFPRVLTARKLDITFPNLAFFGPFPASKIVFSVLKLLRKQFPYSDHKIGRKACFYHHLGLCDPCPNEIKTKSAAQIYRKNIYRIKNILSGNFSAVINELNQQLSEYSINQEYEKANQILQKIKNLEYITQPVLNISEFLQNPNLLEDLQNRELRELQKIIKITHKLTRIECFDVAHLSGSFATASQVTFIEGNPEKTLYRTFRIRQQKTLSDLDSIREVAHRRFKNLSLWGKPDLIIVDGGKAQVKAFFDLFAAEKIPVIGLAKKRETLILPDNQMIILQNGPAKYLLQRIRNEAHRFAQKYHHQLIKRSLV